MKSPADCANIFVEDLDMDGDADLITSSAHSYGVWWWENVNGKTLLQHVIDKSFSQSHALQYVDIDGDGQRDIVTGKRYFAAMATTPEPMSRWSSSGTRSSGSAAVRRSSFGTKS